MSITVSIPNMVADEIYWYLLEALESQDRGTEAALDWLEHTYRPKLARFVWPHLTTGSTVTAALVDLAAPNVDRRG